MQVWHVTKCWEQVVSGPYLINRYSDNSTSPPFPPEIKVVAYIFLPAAEFDARKRSPRKFATISKPSIVLKAVWTVRPKGCMAFSLAALLIPRALI